MEQPSTSTRVVRVTVPFLSGRSRTELLEGELVFDPCDPYAVTMHLEARSGTVVWAFARELLAEGVYTPIGDGDVQVWPCLDVSGEAVVVVELRPPGGSALLQAPARTICDFLARSAEVVPVGEEAAHLSLDSTITRLLAGT